MTGQRVLVRGGGDVGSAVAHRLFRAGLRVLLCDRSGSAHARRGMAFTDAQFDGVATLEGVEARLMPDLAAVSACWAQARCIPVVTQPESQLLQEAEFDVLVDAIMRREQYRPDMRGLAALTVGLGPGYVPAENCHVAIESQWGPSMGAVLWEGRTATRTGGPLPLDGVGRERFVAAPQPGCWRTGAQLGAPVAAGDPLGRLEGLWLRAPVDGHLRGLARDGVTVQAGQRLIEVDPREVPQIFGLGERPAAIAGGVLAALLQRALQPPVGSRSA